MRAIGRPITAGLATLTLVIGLLAAAASMTPVDAQGRAVLGVYTHNDERENEFFVRTIEGLTGIRMETVRMSSGELWARVQAEKPRFGADVVFGMLHSMALLAVKEGFLEPYKAPSWEAIPAEFRDPEGRWHGWSYWYNVIAVNTDLLKRKNLPAPKTWQDLVKPQYRGEIVMPDPGTSGTAFLAVSSIMQIMGEARGWAYLTALHRNVAQYTKSGSAPAEMVARGEFAVGITWDQAVFVRKARGFPIEAIVPEEGVGFDLDVVWIFRGARNMDAARRLVHFLGTPAGQTMAGKMRSRVTRPGIEALVPFQPKLIKYDAVWAGENRDRIMRTWRERFAR
jgi:iron(III) transport system substrate-binding protein